MLLNLAVGEFENLESIVKRSLSRFRFRKVVDYFQVREGLLDILIIKVDYGVAIRERFTLDSVVKNHFLLSIGVHSLDFTIASNVLVYHLGAGRGLGVVLSWELKTEVFLLFLFVLRCLIFFFV